MVEAVEFIDLKLIPYKKAWDIQTEYFDSLIERKLQGNKQAGHLIFCEHPHVFTLGKNGDKSNLLMSESALKFANAEYYQSDRGGDITYHGPGQLVGYPILNLDAFSIGLKKYVWMLEESIIKTLTFFGIQSERKEKATGVWINPERANGRKICALGIRASRNVTMHGFALNVSTDLDYFSKIIPCGIPDKSVTSMEKELNKSIHIDEVKIVYTDIFKNIFNVDSKTEI